MESTSQAECLENKYKFSKTKPVYHSHFLRGERPLNARATFTAASAKKYNCMNSNPGIMRTPDLFLVDFVFFVVGRQQLSEPAACKELERHNRFFTNKSVSERGKGIFDRSDAKK